MEQPEIKVNHIETKSVMTKSNTPIGGYSVNPYVGCPHACKYCYASFMKRFTGHTEEWGTFMDVKDWPEIKNPKKYAGQKVIIGTVTDGYNPLEETYKNTRRLLEELKDSGADILICTKSDLVLRDLDLLKEINENSRLTVSWSINTLDEEFKDDMDAAVSIERRLAAMKEVYAAGIRTICFISPVFPGITDIEAIIDRTKDQCDLVWLENLNLRGGFKADIMKYISDKHPDLVPLYDEIYNKKNRSYFEALEKKAEELAKKYDCRFVDNETPYRGRPSTKTRRYQAMRIILKIIAAPAVLALTLIVAVLNFSVSLASWVLGILSLILAVCGLFELFIQSNPQWGSTGLVLAFLLSPFGLPAAAEWLVCKLDDLNYSLKTFIAG